MFEVKGGGYAFHDLTARDAAAKAWALKWAGINDVEIFQSHDLRISQYSLDQVIRSETETDQ